jgi:hypothetical protein
MRLADEVKCCGWSSAVNPSPGEHFPTGAAPPMIPQPFLFILVVGYDQSLPVTLRRSVRDFPARISPMATSAA